MRLRLLAVGILGFLFAAVAAGIAIAQAPPPNQMVCNPVHVVQQAPNCYGQCQVVKETGALGGFKDWKCTAGTCAPAVISANVAPGVCVMADPESNCTSGLLANIGGIPVGSCPGCDGLGDTSDDPDVQPECDCGTWEANDPPQCNRSRRG
jgi:hypothetical protein